MMDGNIVEGNTVTFEKMPCYVAIYPHSTFKISESWIAQASYLYSDLHSRGYVDDDDDLEMISEYLIDHETATS